jgi:hypothetical protein
VHHRSVRQAIADALPPPLPYPRRVKPKLDAVAAFIDRVLDDDVVLRAGSGTRHGEFSAGLREFLGASLAESTVRNHLCKRKRQMGLVPSMWGDAVVFRTRQANDPAGSTRR